MKEALVARRVVTGAAWAVPVILVGRPAAAQACSPAHVVTFLPQTDLASSTATKRENGHTLGTFTWGVCNRGVTTIPAQTTFTATFTADKAPGAGKKSVTLTPEEAAGITVSPSRARTLNPDGPPKGEATVTMSLSLDEPLAPGDCVSQVWAVDSETGVGATELRLTVALASYGNGACGETGAGGNTTATAIWGAGG